MNASIRWVSAKLALFTVVTVLVTSWLASVIGNFRPFDDTYTVTAEFTDATGLLRGDVVKAAGVTVGQVEDIRIDDGLAVVTMSLEESAQIPEPASAEIRFRNLIGQRMIMLVAEPVAANPAFLAEGSLIPVGRTDPAFDLTVLFDGLRPLIRSTDPKDVNIVTRAVTEALRGRVNEVEGFLGNVAAISDSVAAKDRELSELLKNANVLTSDLAGRDVQLRNTLGALNGFLGDIDEGKDELSAALVSLDEAANRLRRIVRRNDSNIRGEVADLSVILDAVDDKRNDLRGVLRALPKMLLSVERANGYGEWGMIYLVNACKDDLGVCGTRGRR